MLSLQARSLLGIPPDEALPTALPTLYDTYFAGRSYETRFGKGWNFRPRGGRSKDGYDECLEERTAQCHFYLDAECRVFVEAEEPVQIATSFVTLVEEDALLVGSAALGKTRRGFDLFDSMDSFLSFHGEYVQGWPQIPFPDAAFGRYFLGPRSVVGLSRSYCYEYKITALEYF